MFLDLLLGVTLLHRESFDPALSIVEGINANSRIVQERLNS